MDRYTQLGLQVTLAMLSLLVGGLILLALITTWDLVVMQAAPRIEAGLFLSLSRASALVGYVLLWGSMVFGLAISTRAVRIWPGGPTALDLHQHLSLLGLLFAALHVVALLGDQSLGYTLAAALIPIYGSSYRPLWMGVLGKLALYLMVAVALSIVLKPRIGARWWRRIHYLSFAVFGLTLSHAVFAGSDTMLPWVRALYLVSAASLLALGIYRILRARRIQTSSVAQIQAGPLTLDPIARTVVRSGERPVSLRASEARLLFLLMQHPGKTIPTDEILAQIWGRHYMGEHTLVAIYVRRLCAKIEPDPNQPTHLVAVPQQGYCFQP